MTQPIAVIQLRKEPHYRRNAFEQGLKRLGYGIVVDTKNVLQMRPAGPDDLLVMWNKKAGLEERQADEWERHGGTVIVTENAYLQKVDKSSYAISTHGHNGSGWYPVGDEDRFSKLGFELKPDRPQVDMKRDLWLVVGQRGIGSKLMASPPQWGEKTFKKLKDLKLNVHLRPHPGNFAPKVPLLDDLKRTGICCVWSSSAGVMALVEGVVVQHSAPHWICSGAGGPHRGAVLNRMAHGQWSVAEIESGEPFARMQAEGWGPRTWR